MFYYAQNKRILQGMKDVNRRLFRLIDFCVRNPNYTFSEGFGLNEALLDRAIVPNHTTDFLRRYALSKNNKFANSLKQLFKISVEVPIPA